MFIKRKLVIRSSFNNVSQIIERQIRRLPLKGYYRDKRFKLYKSVAFKNKWGVITFCFCGKIVDDCSTTTVQYYIRPNLSCILSMLIEIMWLIHLMTVFLLYRKPIILLFLLLFSVHIFIYLSLIISQKNQCLNKFISVLQDSTD